MMNVNMPTVSAEQAAVDQFLARNEGKPVVVVQGLGFVGAVMSLVVANAPGAEYAVIGVDLDNPRSRERIRLINEGTFPIAADDAKIDQFYSAAREKGNLLASFDPYCYSKADVVIVDINLDVQKDSDADKNLLGYDVSLDGFRKAMRTVGMHCRPDVLVVVETTVPPGTCQKIVRPILEECLRERGLPTDQFRLGHSYERVMPGPGYIDSIQNFYRVYSGIDDRSADATRDFLTTVISTETYPLTRLGNTTSTEMAKVLENSFRAMNIAFVSEWAQFAEEAGVNLYEVVEAIRMRPTHRNLMLPGLGVGGYCLTKDPLLASWSRRNLFGSEQGLAQSEAGVRINDRMPENTFAILQKAMGKPLGGTTTLLLGVSYLNDVGDTRYTPVELLYQRIRAKGGEVLLHDPHVPYWEEVEQEVPQDLDAVLAQPFEQVVFCTGHRNYRQNPKLIAALMAREGLTIIDSIGVLKPDEIQTLRSKHTLKVVGRGDL